MKVIFMNIKLNHTYLIIAIGILVFLSTTAFSQQYAKQAIWKIGGNALDAGNDIQPTTDGGYIVVGYTFSYGAGFCDVYIAKMDKLGVLEWTKVIGTSDLEFGHSVEQTTDYGYIVSGWYLSNTTGNYSAFIIKLDSSGTVKWNKIYSNNNGNSICLTKDGGYAIVGIKPGKVSVLKIDSIGNVEWSKLYGGSQTDIGKSIQQTSDGGYFVVGSTNSFGAGGYDVYAIKLASNGAIEWTKTFGDTGDDYGESGQQTSDGGYIIGGYTEAPAKNGNPSNINAYIIKLTPSGDLTWTKSIGGSKSDYIFSIRQTKDGGYITGGYSQSFAQVGSSVLADSSAFYVIKTDSMGTVNWSKAFSHQANTTNVNNGTYGIRQTADGGYVGVGTWYLSDDNFSNEMYVVKLDASGNSCDGIAVVNSEQAGPNNIVSDSGTAISITSVPSVVGQITSGGSVKVVCQVDATVPPTGIKALSSINQFSIYPNPAQNRIFIRNSNKSLISLNLIEIYNILGRKVLEMKVLQNSQNVMKIDISTLNSGVFFIKLLDSNGTGDVLKFMKE